MSTTKRIEFSMRMTNLFGSSSTCPSRTKVSFSVTKMMADIVEICNLTGMEKLTKLQLDNNIIIKIQGLDELVNLKWLDLSFNLIEKIEGLDNLKELEDLSLFSN